MAGFDIFLKLDGIDGESTTKGHEKEIEVVSYDQSIDSTVPSGGGGGTIPSRVDLPKATSWEIFRADPDNDLGFPEMAWEAQHHPCFRLTPDCWGKQMISITDDEGAGITGRQVSTQVRINVHLTIQAEASSIMPTDEGPYED